MLLNVRLIPALVALNPRHLPLCRGDRGEDNLVEKPSSHEKLLSTIKERAKYADVKLELWSVLNDVPFKDIDEKVLMAKQMLSRYHALRYVKKSKRKIRKRGSWSR